MALFARSPNSTDAAVAEYARILDGEHLWLAVRGEGPLVLRREGADDVEIPTTADSGLLIAVFPLAAALPDAGEVGEVALRLLSGSGRRATPVAFTAERPAGPTIAEPPARPGWQLSAGESDGELVVRRTKVTAGVRVLGIHSVADGVEISLDAVGSVAVRVGDATLGEIAIVDGGATLSELPDLPSGKTAALSVGETPLCRNRNVLARPHFAVALPPMPEPDVELRWLKDGRLAVHRRAPGVLDPL